jgi:hypothetical protein
MPLLALWKSSPSEISQLAIEQVIGNAGDGILRDNSDCSIELRTFLSEVPSASLVHTLASGIKKLSIFERDAPGHAPRIAIQ